jgi:hypothetical protein
MEMGDGYNFQILSAAILKLSRATDWVTACREWVLIDIYESDQPETCLCQHFPIIEICVIKNIITKAVAEVGNVCVKRFLGIRSDLIFVALKRVRKDVTRALNEDAIAFFYKANLINDWEYGFLQDTKKKRSLSAAQMRTRMQLNQRVVNAVATRGIQGNSK